VLGVSPERVSRHHNFFDEGGNSLSAVELVIALDSAVSLTDVTRNPVLSELALLIESGSAPRSCLLQPLSEADDQPGGTLVCFPYAGGNAVNFQAMARELRGSGLEILAVELPGHDLTSEAEPFLSIEQVVDQVVAEISEREPRDLFLWGHSSGAAYALAAARRLEEHGVGARRLFIGAQLLGDATHRLAHIEQLRNHSNAEVAAELSRDRGYTELRQLTAAHAEQVGAAYRHDCVSAHRDFVAALENPPSARLAAPVTVVVAADDPSAAGWRQRYRDWELVAGDVGLHELATGGHYFLRTRPRQAAEAVRRTAGLSAAGT